MRPILNCTSQLSDKELEGLLTGALFYLVSQVGGEVVLTRGLAADLAGRLTRQMVQMQIGEDITLKIIRRPKELQMGQQEDDEARHPSEDP